MSREKALIYTVLLLVIISVLWISSCFIKNDEGKSLYDFLCITVFPLMASWYVGGRIARFYEWLIKTKDSKDNKNDKEDEQGTTDLNIFTGDLDIALRDNLGDYLPLTKVADTAKTLKEKGWNFEKKENNNFIEKDLTKDQK